MAAIQGRQVKLYSHYDLPCLVAVVRKFAASIITDMFSFLRWFATVSAADVR